MAKLVSKLATPECGNNAIHLYLIGDTTIPEDDQIPQNDEQFDAWFQKVLNDPNAPERKADLFAIAEGYARQAFTHSAACGFPHPPFPLPGGLPQWERAAPAVPAAPVTPTGRGDNGASTSSAKKTGTS